MDTIDLQFIAEDGIRHTDVRYGVWHWRHRRSSIAVARRLGAFGPVRKYLSDVLYDVPADRGQAAYRGAGVARAPEAMELIPQLVNSDSAPYTTAFARLPDSGRVVAWSRALPVIESLRDMVVLSRRDGMHKTRLSTQLIQQLAADGIVLMVVASVPDMDVAPLVCFGTEAILRELAVSTGALEPPGPEAELVRLAHLPLLF